MNKNALLIWLSSGFGGAERRLIRIYNEIAKNKDSVYLVLKIPKGYDSEFSFKKMNIDINHFESVKCYSSRLGIIKDTLTSRYSTVHFFGEGISWFIIILLGKLLNIKTIASIVEIFSAQDIKTGKDRILSHLIWKFSDHVDLLYPFCQKIVLLYRPKKALTCTPGTFTDLNVFYPQKKEKIMLFNSARLELHKGPQLLVLAVDKIANSLRNENYKIILTGQGYLEKEIQGNIQEKGLNDIIQTVGYIAPQQYMSKAEVVFSLGFGIPNYPSQVVAEAAASGCCIIATRHEEDPKEFLNDSFTLFCDETADSLAQAILYYINLSEKDKLEFQKNARVHAEEYFNVQRSVEYFKEIISDLTNKL